MSESTRTSVSVARPVRLIGRDREIALLRAHLAAALAGMGGLVLLGGEAGIGKTALAEHLLAEARDRGALVLIGRCYDLSETPPYGPWRELFEAAPAAADLPALPVALLPAERDSETLPGQGAIIRRVREYLAALVTRQPLVLLLDDLHWADPVSLDLLRAIGRHLADLPLLLLATYRDDEPVEGQPLADALPALVREARAERLTLSRLGDEAMRAFAHARYRLPAGDEARLVRYLHARAEGNPFYLGELLRSLEEAALLHPAPDGEGWMLGDLTDTRVPPLLRLIIGGRAARLGAGTGRLLAVAAVIGQAVPLDLWATAGDADDEALADAIGRAGAARMLAETPDGAGVRFAHALVRETLYEAIPLPRRRGLHRRVGEALLATANPDPDAVAGHFQRAGDPRALEWLIQAGHRALRSYANRTAAARYETALGLLRQESTNHGLRGWCLLYLSQARYWDDALGGIARLEEALRLSDEADDRALAAYARYLLGFHRCALGDFRRGIDEMIAGAATLDTLTAPERALMEVLGQQTFEYVGTLMLRFAYVGRYAEAQQTAQRLLPQQLNPRVGCALGEVYAGLGQASDAVQAWARARAGMQRDGDHWNLGLFIMFELHGTILPYLADDLLTRRQLADESERAITAAGDMHSIESARVGRLSLLAIEGDWAEASTIAEGVCASNRTYHPQAASILATIARAQGDVALAQALIRRLLPDGPAEEPGGTWHFDALRQQRLAAELALDAGDLAAARAWLAAHDRWLAWNGAVRGRAEGQLAWAKYHRAAGDLVAAVACAERALAHATEPRQPLALLAAHRLLGELATAAGQHAAAQAHLGTALALADACAAPYERALTLLALAASQLGDDQREGARTVLVEARAICTRLGAGPALARCAALAARLGDEAATPTDADRADAPARHPGRLTAREVEVLRLVAAGRSNREMAAAFGRSERTIERHLENIYRKIDARNRADATAFALRHRLA